MTVAIVLVDDHPEVRETVRIILSSDVSFTLVGEATDGYEAIRLARAEQPDIVLMDITLPDLDGFEVTRRIRQAHPQVCVVMLSTHEHPGYVSESLRAGAIGYVVKRRMGRDLVTAVRAATREERYISPGVRANPGLREPAADAPIVTVRPQPA